MITPRLINHKAYTLPFFLPERCLSLSARCVKKPGGCTDSNSVSRVSHVSVKQRMLQSLLSLWKATPARISSTLLSRDWTLANSKLGSGARCARLRSLTRRPLLLPLMRRRCFGLPAEVRSIVLGGGPNRPTRGSTSGKSYSWSLCWYVDIALISDISSRLYVIKLSWGNSVRNNT